MGREVRMVPPNWEHPKYVGHGIQGPEMRLRPMHDRRYEDAAKEWIEGFIKWHVEKEYPDYADLEDKVMPYWDWSGPPPEKQYYRPWKDEEATWFQVWETVSEGTPVTPPFATKEELVDYLVAHGDTWDQKRGDAPWTRENAEAFVGAGWAPSFVIAGGKVMKGGEQAAEIDAELKTRRKAEEEN